MTGEENTKVFHYSSDDFSSANIPWPKDGELFQKSKFDTALCEAWEEVEKNGVFWYNLDEVKRKSIPGQYNMMAQLNVKRFAQRRKPEAATQVMMPFNPDKFHFGKIKQSEVLFELKQNNEEPINRIIINVSPIEYGHVLITPTYKENLPQVLTATSIHVASEICLQTSHRGFCVGFNSLCALASVNHLHLHAMYVDHRLPIVTAKATKLHEGIFTFDDYMVNGYVLQLTDVSNIAQFSRSAVDITTYLAERNIAHNVVMCRRESIESSTYVEGCTYVTMFIFPKKPSPEMTDDPFNCAFLENAGFLPMRDNEEYEKMCEATALKIFRKFTYAKEEFQQLSSDLVATLTKDST